MTKMGKNSMTDGDFPADALERATVEVQLGDGTYTWTEPGERACRALLRRFVEIEVEHGIVGATEDPIQILNLVDAAQDVLYDLLKIPKGKRAGLDDTAQTAQILNGYGAISKVLQRPFLGLETSMAQEKEETEIPSPPGETMTS